MANIILSNVRKYQYSSINMEKLVKKSVRWAAWLTPVHKKLLKESNIYTLPYPIIMATIFRINKKMDIRFKLKSQYQLYIIIYLLSVLELL